MQLLQITVTPMKYDLEIQNAKLEYKQEFIPKVDIRTTAPEFKLATRDIKVKLDTYQARRSLGFATVKDMVFDAAEKGKAALTSYIRNTTETGNQLAHIEDGVTIKQILDQKMLEQPMTYTAFLPNTGAEISWQPGSINTEFQPSKVTNNWQIKGNSMKYIPGSVKMNILEYAHIDIEYLGGPMYIPRSADPNYVEPSDD